MNLQSRLQIMLYWAGTPAPPNEPPVHAADCDLALHNGTFPEAT